MTANGSGVKLRVKRGRPKSFVRLKQEKQDDEFRKSIEFDKNENAGTASEKNLARVKSHIALWKKQYGNGILIPMNAYVVMGMMLEFAAFKGKEALVEAIYKKALSLGKKSRQAGTEGIKQKARRRAEDVWQNKINKSLANKVQAGKLTTNSAIKIILADWNARGDGTAKAPSPKTLNDWYKNLYPQK
jgi:hypothetical protein